MVPVRISATAEFKGGDDDFRDYYCPTIEWNWGDGTVSEASADCEPYEAGCLTDSPALYGLNILTSALAPIAFRFV